ncbi:hypothetical protein [Dongshaea marina]|nr:hypothetical protein [Dongshaea marina]
MDNELHKYINDRDRLYFMTFKIVGPWFIAALLLIGILSQL